MGTEPPRDRPSDWWFIMFVIFGLLTAPALYLSWRKRDRAVAARYLKLGLGIWFTTGFFGWMWVLLFNNWQSSLRS
ncbi:MAG: hypothetical protein MPI95_06480 [Nitrosopumilus sp.]|nr:hypothetical protein [Nitrosopumilus sp.]MDA7958715.1 hypothetical protein [Nitrosopumilus sp.]